MSHKVLLLSHSSYNRKIYKRLALISLYMKKLRIKPVTHEDLKKIFTGRFFKSRLRRAMDITSKTNCEVPFSVVRDIYTNKYTYIDIPDTDQGVSMPYDTVSTAYCDEAMVNIAIERGYTYENLANEIYLILSIHTHPSGLAAPSEEDIRNVMLARMAVGTLDISTDKKHLTHEKKWEQYPGTYKIDNYPISAFVGGLDRKKQALEIVLIQPTGVRGDVVYINNRSQDIFEKVVEGMLYESNETLTDALDPLPDFNAAYLRYERTEGGAYKPVEEQLDILDRLSFTPKLIT